MTPEKLREAAGACIECAADEFNHRLASKEREELKLAADACTTLANILTDASVDFAGFDEHEGAAISQKTIDNPTQQNIYDYGKAVWQAALALCERNLAAQMESAERGFEEWRKKAGYAKDASTGFHGDTYSSCAAIDAWRAAQAAMQAKLDAANERVKELEARDKEYSRFKSPTVEDIEQRMNATTPGEWSPWCGQGWPKHWAEYLGLEGDHETAWGITADSVKHDPHGHPKIILCKESNDSTFVAFAKRDIRWLIAALATAERERDELERCMKSIGKEVEEDDIDLIVAAVCTYKRNAERERELLRGEVRRCWELADKELGPPSDFCVYCDAQREDRPAEVRTLVEQDMG